MLCYFEGRSHDEAAAALRWPVGTVRGRLSRARDLLRSRLSRRGLVPAGWIGATAPETIARAEAEAPAALRSATVAVAIRGTPAAGVVGLTKLMLRSLFMARAKMAAAALGFVLMAAGLGLALRDVLATSTPQRTDLVPSRAATDQPQPPPIDRPEDLLPKHARRRLGSAGFHHGSTVNEVLYTRDGRFLVTADIKRVVSVWDPASGRLLHQIRLSGDLFDRIAVSPDGTTFATTEPNPDHPLRLWDVATGLERRRWHVKGSSQSPAFSPDGRTLMTDEGESDPTTKQWVNFLGMWDVTAPTERRRKLVGKFGGFQISPDGRTLIVIGTRNPQGAIDGSLYHIWDLTAGRERSPLMVDGLNFCSLRFSPDGKLLLGALTDGTIRVYDPATGRERPPRLGPVPRIPAGPAAGEAPAAAGRPIVMASMTFSPDGAILATASTINSGVFPWWGAIHFWDFARGKELHRTPTFRRGASSLSFSPDGKRLAAAVGWEPIVRFWDVATGHEVSPPAGHVQGITALAVSPADSTIFTGSKDGMIRRWDPASGRELGLITQLDDGGLELAVAPDGRTLLARSGRSGESVLWSVAEGREVWRLGIANRVGARYSGPWVAYSPDGRTVAAERTVWDVATGKALIVLRRRRRPKRSFPARVSTCIHPMENG